ncbi:MAG: pyridoxal-dependent decarboxylase, exosortase A system-associated [Motiliproteus sp.]|nr:pyridoxal-dependent decarboxylase, exosortase A system-associated [Motiliproteus sp.]MCW9052565.1 pyridoxal-dependent decarboxylase, exosortase A system-associated [Motiliproteus sp.]
MIKAKKQHALTWYDTRENEIYLNKIPLSRLAARVGQTPFYAYDRSLLSRRVQELRDTLPSSIKLHYAVKANPMPALVCHMAGLVDGLDVASVKEMHTALNTGTAPEHISFAGPGKSYHEITAAVAAGIVLNVESLEQLKQAAKAGQALNLKPRIAVRINPEFELKSSGMKMTGGAKPFGIDTEQFPLLMEEARKLNIEPEGLHLFTGSQNLNPEALREAQSGVISLAKQLIEEHGLKLRFINIGGGLGIPYFPGEEPLDLQAVANNLEIEASAFSSQHPDIELVIELGRYLVGEAGVYVCSILERKISRGTTYLITDGGLHHHLSNSGNFGQVIRKNYPVLIGNRMDSDDMETVTIVGPLCTPLDIVANQVDLPHTEVGDLVVVKQSGAYGLSASPTAFLSHPDALEALV